jgi:hypothetical protein
MGNTISEADIDKLNRAKANDPSLKSLIFRNTFIIGDLEFMRGNTFIQELRIINCWCTLSLEPLRDNTTVECLEIADCNIESLEPLRCNKTICTLVLNRNGVVDISPLRENYTIRTLYLSGNPIVDATPIESMESVEHLDMDGCEIQDANPILRNKAITSVSICNNHVSTIDHIRFNTTLSTLYAEANPIPKEHKMIVLNNVFLMEVTFDNEDDDGDILARHIMFNNFNFGNRWLTLKDLTLEQLLPSECYESHDDEKVEMN